MTTSHRNLRYDWLTDEYVDDEYVDTTPTDDSRPLPLIVAERWGFPLQHYIIDGEHWYAVRDWIAGLAGTEASLAAKMWSKMKRSEPELSTSSRQFSYTVADGRKYASDFTDERGLYMVAQKLRVTKTRETLRAILEFLANAGVFVDELRRDPEKRAELAAAIIDDDPEAAVGEVLDRVGEGYRKKGRTDSWIEVRVQGIVTRRQFTDALKAAVIDATPSMYARTTVQLYRGLLDRTAAQLRGDLGLKSKQNPRDHMGEYALAYVRMAERLCRDLLADAEAVKLSQALDIIWQVTKLIKQQYDATQNFLGRDLVTGRPLLADGDADSDS